MKKLMDQVRHRAVKDSQVILRDSIEQAREMTSEAERRIIESRQMAERALIMPAKRDAAGPSE